MSFEVLPRSTRSGATFSPFQISPITFDKSFDLAECIKLSTEQEERENAMEDAQPTMLASQSECGTPPERSAFPVVDSTLTNDEKSSPLKRPHADDVPAAGGSTYAHRKRRLKRDAVASALGHLPRPKVMAAHVNGDIAMKTDLCTKGLPVNSSGYAARRTQGEGIYFDTLQEALDAGNDLVKWKGRSCLPLLCSDERVFGCAVGQPDDPTYAESCRLAYEAIMDEGRKATFSYAEQSHRRGDFPAVNTGVTMGLGATYPTNLDAGRHADMLGRLLGNAHIKRLAHFADGAFAMWAPKVYERYHTYLGKLFETVPYLRHIFSKSVFAAAAFNFGPNVCTKSHRDLLNLPIGWCAIQALGAFDPEKGGHLVLPGLKIVLEFPPGALILIPSATLTHANVRVQEGDSRVSFTQYCSGGLFRYVDNGCRTEKQLRQDDDEEHRRICGLKRTRWESDLTLYSRLSELVGAT